MKDAIVGIREEDLRSLCLEILDYADRISEIFDKIDLKMDKLPEYYQGDSSTKIQAYYNNLSSNYLTIKNNVISYSDDLICLIQKMKENEKYLLSLFNNYTIDTKNKIKSVKG